MRTIRFGWVISWQTNEQRRWNGKACTRAPVSSWERPPELFRLRDRPTPRQPQTWGLKTMNRQGLYISPTISRKIESPGISTSSACTDLSSPYTPILSQLSITFSGGRFWPHDVPRSRPCNQKRPHVLGPPYRDDLCKKERINACLIIHMIWAFCPSFLQERFSLFFG